VSMLARAVQQLASMPDSTQQPVQMRPAMA
jgi:hypothetical protein